MLQSFLELNIDDEYNNETIININSNTGSTLSIQPSRLNSTSTLYVNSGGGVSCKEANFYNNSSGSNSMINLRLYGGDKVLFKELSQFNFNLFEI
jgi:hypothetical protein